MEHAVSSICRRDGHFHFYALILLLSIELVAAGIVEIGLFGESMDVVMNGPNFGPDFSLIAKRNGTRTDQTWRFVAAYLSRLNTTGATALGQYGWQGNVTEMETYDLLDPQLVWQREDNVETFNGTADALRFCTVLLKDNITVCVDFWHFNAQATIHFNYTGQFAGFVLDRTLEADRFKWGISVKNWGRRFEAEYMRTSMWSFYSEPLVDYAPLLTPYTWDIILGPVNRTKASLNLTLLNFADEDGQLRYLTWTSERPGITNGTETVDAVKTFIHMLDASIINNMYYDPDCGAFFGDVSLGGDDDESGDDDNQLTVILVAVLVPVIVVSLVGTVIVVTLGIFFRNKLRLWWHRHKRLSVSFGMEESDSNAAAEKL